MKEISKKNFIEIITERPTKFVGIAKEIKDNTFGIAKDLAKNPEIKLRNCKAKSNGHLVFDGDSHLYLSDTKEQVNKCYREGNIFVVEQKWHDDFDDTDYYKYLLYVV